VVDRAPDALRARRCLVVRGHRVHTEAAARALVARLPPDDTAWLGGRTEERLRDARARPRRRRIAAELLGRSVSAVVLDLHDGLDADLLGLAAGLVRGGGSLVLRMPAEHEIPRGLDERLAVWPYGVDHVGHRAWERLLRLLRGAPEVVRAVDVSEGAVPACLTPLEVAPRPRCGTAAQRAAADAVADALRWRAPETTWTSVGTRPLDDASTASAGKASAARTAIAEHTDAPVVVLAARRGRGKSAALGLALAALPDALRKGVVVAAPSAEAAEEVRRFAGQPLSVAAPTALCDPDARAEAIVIDEAAQIPLPLLRRIVAAHPCAPLALATTCDGYEGTGRGFVLRFLAWLRETGRPLREFTLDEPIRWPADDPLERLVADVLGLDAQPARLPRTPTVRSSTRAAPAASEGRPYTPSSSLRAEAVDRDALVERPRVLEEIFGLLVHAHYRTTPADLVRLLDAPNLSLHVLREGAHVVAVTLLAAEGGLPPADAEALRAGVRRIRGHVLPEVLAAQCGRTEGARLRIVRSVRIAVHPDRRRLGLAARLVEHVHETYSPDLFGTVFGATPDLIAFRRAVGYELVRLGVSGGAASGERAAVMLRPVTPAARALVAGLRAELVRNLEAWRALRDADEPYHRGGNPRSSVPGGPRRVDDFVLGAPSNEAADGSCALDRAIDDALADVDVVPLDDEALAAAVQRYIDGVVPFDAVAGDVAEALRRWGGPHVKERAASAALLRCRIMDRRSWTESARAAGLPSAAAAMKALRAAVAASLRRRLPSPGAAPTLDDTGKSH
jgi:tRNA(Met) cytidine acetyltransferase